MSLGTTALSSMAAAIANGGAKENSPYRDEQGFEEAWDTLVTEVTALPAGTDLELPFDLDEDSLDAAWDHGMNLLGATEGVPFLSPEYLDLTSQAQEAFTQASRTLVEVDPARSDLAAEVAAQLAIFLAQPWPEDTSTVVTDQTPRVDPSAQPEAVAVVAAARRRMGWTGTPTGVLAKARDRRG